MEIDVRLDDRKARRVLRELQERGARLRPLMADIAEELPQSTQERFNTQTAPDGTAWKALHPETIKKKRRIAEKEPAQVETILTLRGHLRDSLTADYGEDFAAVNTNREYAPAHQFGIGVPARPFLGLSQTDRAEVLALAQDYLDEVAGY